MEEALAAQLRASLPDAERLYRAALTIDPHAADALHMLGAICYQTGRLLEGYDLIRKALEETGWQIPMIRHNFALVLSSMLATDDAVDAMLSGEEGLGARIEADSRVCANALGVAYVGPFRTTDDSGRVNVLVIDDSVPAPDRDSGSVRLTAIIEILRALGCNLTFVARGVEFGGPSCSDSGPWASKCFASPIYGTSDSCWRPGARNSTWCGRANIEARRNASTAVRRCAPRALFVLDTVDVHYLRETREADVTGDPAARRRSAVTRERELAMVRDADVTLVVSESERNALLAEVPDADVRVVSNVLPAASSAPGFGERRDMLFVGAFGHSPNVDAINWYAREIWPRVRRRLPDARTLVIGSDMPEAVRDLAGEGLEAVGYVPDLAPYLQRCRLSIAPLRFGAGVKGKISTAQASGLPVVATSIAVEGMNLESGRDVLVADTAEAFADAILRLHEDATLWARVASGGRENVARHFSADVARPVLAGLVEAASSPRAPGDIVPADVRYLVLVPAAYGSLGDSAMVHGAIEGIRNRFPNARIDLLSIYSGERWPRIPRHRQGHRRPSTGMHAVAVGSALPSPGGGVRLLRAARRGCPRRPLRPDESVARLELLRLAHAVGLETRVLGFSMNEHPADAACAALSEIGAFAPLFARDPISMSRLEARGVPGLVSAADVAFLMRPDGASPSGRNARAWVEEQRAAGRPVIALSLSSSVLAEARLSGNADVVQSCVALIVALERSHRASILILPHDLRSGPPGRDDDVAIAYRIAGLLESAASAVPHHVHVTCNAPEMKGLVGLADLAVTGRMHLAIAALGMAVPVIALAYQGKFDGMMQRFELGQMVFDPRSFDEAALYAGCVRLLESAPSVKAALRRRLPDVVALAHANFAAIQPRRHAGTNRDSAAD